MRGFLLSISLLGALTGATGVSAATFSGTPPSDPSLWVYELTTTIESSHAGGGYVGYVGFTTSADAPGVGNCAVVEDVGGGQVLGQTCSSPPGLDVVAALNSQSQRDRLNGMQGVTYLSFGPSSRSCVSYEADCLPFEGDYGSLTVDYSTGAVSLHEFTMELFARTLSFTPDGGGGTMIVATSGAGAFDYEFGGFRYNGIFDVRDIAEITVTYGITSRLVSAPVIPHMPVPGALPLLAGGLVALAVMARARRRT